MLEKRINALKKQYHRIRVLLAPHPFFKVIDKVKLSKIKKSTDKKGFVFLKPKGWKHTIKIRRNYTDREVVHYVLQDQYHLPPKTAQIPKNPVILDLGSNIGLTIAHMKHIYPGARIIGYEMNQENFKLAQRNTKFLEDVIVNNQAVWTENTTVTYRDSSGHDAYSIIDQDDTNNSGQEIEVASRSIASIISDHNLTHIDYLKMDIEGAEEAILDTEDKGWMDIVHAMNIEMHLEEEKDIERYIKIIEDKGFHAWKDDKHWSSIFAVRNEHLDS